MKLFRNKQKLFILLFALFSLFTVVACNELEVSTSSNQENSNSASFEENTVKTVTFLAMNDTHGHLENESNAYIAKSGAYIKQQKAERDAVVIAVGDMFQGTAISNLTKGRAMVESMNLIGFDAMVIGNHEFDWGIQEIAKFANKDESDGEANFPFLAANIYHKGTTNILDFAKSYTVVESNGLKVGIIGIIGEGLTNSISASMVKDYEFGDSVEAVKKAAFELRKNELADIVVLATHNGVEYNHEYSELSGDYKIDAIFNGHTHLQESSSINGTPFIQSGSNGEYVGKVTLDYNIIKKEVESYTVSHISTSDLKNVDLELENYVNNSIEALKPITGEVITKYVQSEEFLFNKKRLAQYSCEVLSSAFDCDLGMVNSGGFRTYYRQNQIITYADVIEMIPFDNTIKLVTLSGSQLKRIFNSTWDIVYNSSVTFQNNNFYLDGVLIDDMKEYRVAAIDYIFDKTYYPFLSGKDIVHTFQLFRDVLVQDIRATNNNWDIFSPCKIGKIEW